MATTINAGRVRFVSRGTYNNSTQYYLFDLVDYNGSSYIAKENTVGNLPTNNQYWQLIAEKGNTGSTGQPGPVGPTGNGIASITKTATSGLVDTYTITYTNGNTTTFTITNGEDANIPRSEFDKLKSENETLKSIINQQPQVSGEGQSVTLNNTIKAPFTKFDVEGHSEQETTEGYQLLKNNGSASSTSRGVNFVKNDDGSVVLNGTYDATGEALYTIFAGAISNTMLKKNVNYYLSDGTQSSAERIIQIYQRETGGNWSFLTSTQVANPSQFSITGDEVWIRIRVSNSTEVTFNNLIMYPMISEVNKPFEKFTYGASPNPSYEQPIKSCGENVNLCNGTSTHKYCASDGTIGLGNTSYLGLNDKIEVKPNTTYTITFFGYEDRTKRIYVGEWDSSNNWIGRTQVNSLTFTTGSSTKYIFIYMYDSTTPFDNISTDIKIEPGTTATPYSPYGMGSITEKIINENLWSSEWEQGNINGTTGQNEINNTIIRTKDFIYFEPEQHYAIKRSIATAFINVRGYDINKKFIGAGSDVVNLIMGETANNPMNNQDTCVISTKPGVYYLRFNDNSNDLATQYMMVKGDTPEDYIEHQEQTYTIPTQQPMRSIGDVRDCFVKKSDGWYERHNSLRSILNGTEYIDLNSEYNNSYSFSLKEFNTIIDKSSATNILCNILKAETSNEPSTIRIATGSGNIIMCFAKDFISYNVDTFKTYLATQYSNGTPVYIDYLLATPLDLPCTEEQIQQLENLPITYAGQTNVFSIDEVEAYLRAKGLLDLNTLVNN